MSNSLSDLIKVNPLEIMDVANKSPLQVNEMFPSQSIIENDYSDNLKSETEKKPLSRTSISDCFRLISSIMSVWSLLCSLALRENAEGSS